MVSDSTMLQSVSLFEGQPVTPRVEVPATGLGIPRENHIQLPQPADMENTLTMAKNVAEQRSAESASLLQQNFDSFVMSTNQSPREIDPFSTAGTVFHART